MLSSIGLLPKGLTVHTQSWRLFQGYLKKKKKPNKCKEPLTLPPLSTSQSSQKKILHRKGWAELISVMLVIFSRDDICCEKKKKDEKL